MLEFPVLECLHSLDSDMCSFVPCSAVTASTSNMPSASGSLMHKMMMARRVILEVLGQREQLQSEYSPKRRGLGERRPLGGLDRQHRDLKGF